jgi:tubulin beta
MGTAISKVLCDENGFRGDGEYSGDSDTKLDLINVFGHWASGGMYVPRADLLNLEPGVIGAVRASPLGELFRPDNLVNHTHGKTGPKVPTNMHTKGLSTNSSAPPPSLPEMQQPVTSAHLKF